MNYTKADIKINSRMFWLFEKNCLKKKQKNLRKEKFEVVKLENLTVSSQ